MDLLTALQFITLLLITLSASCAVGHALELPGKMKLTRDVYLAVQPICTPGSRWSVESPRWWRCRC